MSRFKLSCALLCAISLATLLGAIMGVHQRGLAPLVGIRPFWLRVALQMINAIMTGGLAVGIQARVRATWALGWGVFAIALLESLATTLPNALEQPKGDHNG